MIASKKNSARGGTAYGLKRTCIHISMNVHLHTLERMKDSSTKAFIRGSSTQNSSLCLHTETLMVTMLSNSELR